MEGNGDSKPTVEVDEDGNVSIVLPPEGGTITKPGEEPKPLPGGSIVEEDTGTIKYPDGDGGDVEQNPDGTITLPDVTIIEGNGDTKPSGELDEDGNISIVLPPEGGMITKP